MCGYANGRITEISMPIATCSNSHIRISAHQSGVCGILKKSHLIVMKHLLIALSLFLTFDSNAQHKKEQPEEFTICNVGADASPNRDWMNFLETNLFAADFLPDSIQVGCYTVMVRFIVDVDGKLTDVTVIKDPGYGLGEKVRKVVAAYQGCWLPARQGGRAVKSYRNQPVTFIVEEDDECDELKPEESI